MFREVTRQSAGNHAQGAAINAKFYAEACRVLYTNAQRAKADEFKDLLDLAYYGKSYVTPRKTFIAVKIENYQVRDKKMAAMVLAIAEERGYTPDHDQAAKIMIFKLFTRARKSKLTH